MTSSTFHPHSLGWSSWPPVHLWTCLLLYWLSPGLSCSDQRQSSSATLPISSTGQYGGCTRPNIVVTFNQKSLAHRLKNDTFSSKFTHMHVPHEIYVQLSFYCPLKGAPNKTVEGKEIKGRSFRYSGNASSIPINITVIVNTAKTKGLERQSKLAVTLQQMHANLERQIKQFLDSCNSTTLSILCKSICSHLRFSSRLRLNGLRCYFVSIQRPHVSAVFSHKLKQLHPTVRFLRERRHYRGKMPPRRSREEFVYGQDDRRRISPLLIRTFPYSNVVRLSTGCTGTLLTPLHVLTAAHCVHTGHGFRENLEMMRVEVPYPMGVRVFYIEKISIPSRWRHPRVAQEHQEAWDYAVVTLIYGVHGRSRFYPLAVSTTGMIENDLIFLAYMKEQNGQNHLWISKCPGPSNKPLVDRSLIFTHCDSAVGNSGAAILARDGPSGRKIIGVLSSTIQVRQSIRSSTSISKSKSLSKTPTRPLSFSVITALTWPKLWDICRELGSEGVAYGVCPKPQYIPVKNRHLINNIPFFG